VRSFDFSGSPIDEHDPMNPTDRAPPRQQEPEEPVRMAAEVSASYVG
jgi:hypothetical protein